MQILSTLSNIRNDQAQKYQKLALFKNLSSKSTFINMDQVLSHLKSYSYRMTTIRKAPARGDDTSRFGVKRWNLWVLYRGDPIFVKEPLKKFHGHMADIHNSYMTGTSCGIHQAREFWHTNKNFSMGSCSST